MNELIVALLVWVVANTTYAEPLQSPNLDYKTKAEMVTEICPGKNCDPSAYYEDGTNTIFLRLELRNSRTIPTRADLVHEIVHYLQNQSGHWTEVSCESNAEREREAYRIQSEYLVFNGVNRRLIRQPPWLSTERCDEEQSRKMALAGLNYGG